MLLDRPLDLLNLFFQEGDVRLQPGENCFGLRA
jgi:hypothetical protein